MYLLAAVRRFAAAVICTAASILTATAQNSEVAITTRHAPAINGDGRVEGSVQMLSGESTVLNGGAVVTGDLLVPGVPAVQLNGTPTFGGVIEGSGSAIPSNYTVTLNTGATLGHLRTRTHAVMLPSVPAPPVAGGTRTVTLNSASDSAGDWATARDLTIQGQAGIVNVPPGTYRNFTANGGTAVRIGIAGATAPAIYNLQSLTLNGQATLAVAGPVILTVNRGIAFNGVTGSAAHPEWLQVRVATGGVNLNSGATLYGAMVAPNGTVIVNGGAALYGTAACDRFRLNGGGLVSWRDLSTGGNRPPVANAGTASVAEDDQVEITLTGSDPDENALSYTLLTPPSNGTLANTGAVRFYKPNLNFHGTDTFTFVVSDGQVQSEPATVTISVVPVNDPPVASPNSVVVTEDTPTRITLTGSDVDLDPLVFSAPATTGHGTLLKLTGPADGPGDFLYTPGENSIAPDAFAFTVSDGNSGTAQARVEISITPRADRPVAASFGRTVPEDGELNITLTGQDVDGDEIAFEIVDGQGPEHGTIEGELPNLKYRPAPNYQGNDSFQYIARDAGGLVSEAATVSIVVTPVDDAPVAVGGALEVIEDQAKTFSLVATDAEGEALTYVIVQPPSHGVLSGSGPTFVYTPNANSTEDDSFTFVAVDIADPAELTSAPATVQLILISQPDAPKAEARTWTTSEDSPLTITLSARDDDGDSLTFITPRQSENGESFGPLHGTLAQTEDPRVWIYTPGINQTADDGFTFRVVDPDGLFSDARVSITILPINDDPTATEIPVSVLEDHSAPITLTGVDIEDAALRFEVVAGTGPTNGSLSGNPPELLYQPNYNFAGQDGFDYRAIDSMNAESAPARVNITVIPVNDAPVAEHAPVITQEDASIVIDLSATDAENDPITYQLPTAPAYGTLTYISPGQYRYEPYPNVYATDTFTYTASDGEFTSAPATVVITVTPRPDAPIAVIPQPIETREDTPISFNLGGTDVDGDVVTVQDPANPQHGTLARDANDPTHFIYTPVADFHGVDSFAFTVSDGQFTSAAATVSIDVLPVNDAPVANAGEDLAIVAPAAISLLGTAIDDGDAPGGTLTFVWSQVSGPADVRFANANAPQTTASYTQAGIYQLRLTVSDGDREAVDDLEVTVAMPNRAPAVNAGADQTVTEGAPANLAGAVTDDGLPVGAQVAALWTKVSGSGVVSFADASKPATTAMFSAPGVYELRLRASDAEYSAQDHVIVTIDPVNLAPVVQAGADLELAYGAVAGLLGSVTDDGKPRGGGLAVTWSKGSGPGAVTFANASSSSTSATFSAPGEYVLRLAANDGSVQAFDEIKVTVAPPVNAAPTVSAGPDVTLVDVASTTLQGNASDDGLPEGSALRVKWVKVSGPGAVTFGVDDVAVTSASFDRPGTYVLQLTATDGESSVSDSVSIAVNSANASPTVNAGLDQTIPFERAVSANLLLNASGDVPHVAVFSPNWTNSNNFLRSGQTVANLAPADGTGYFVPASFPPTWDAYQDVDVAAYQAAILEGRQIFHFSGYTASNGGSLPRFAIDYLDVSKTTVLKRLELDGETGMVWRRLMTSCVAPPETRYVRVHLISVTRGSNGAYFDGLRLVAETSPKATLSGVIADDGMPNPPGAVKSKWRQVAGPGTASFTADDASATDVVLPAAGDYIFELQGTDGEFTTTDTVSVFVTTPANSNSPPVITAPAELSAEFPSDVNLTAAVQDDGLPIGGTLTYAWSKISGPGEIYFGTSAALTTTAAFTKPGEYVARFTATDGELSSYADVTVNVPASSQRVPMDVVIAIDTSGSMTAIAAIKSFVTNFVGTLDDGLDRSGLVYYSVGAQVVVPLTGNKVEMYGAIQNYNSGAQSNQISTGISVARQHLAQAGRPGAQKVIVIVSDGGLDVGYEPGPAAAVARAEGIRIAAFGLGSFAIPILPSIVSSKADYFDNPGSQLSTTAFSLAETRFMRGVNLAPQVLPGTNQQVAFGQPVNLGATVTDDGYPQGGSLTIKWEALSGPTDVQFTNPNSAFTEASFASPGTYALQVTGDDGELATSGTVMVEVLPADTLNAAPVVSAGPDFEVAAVQVDVPISGSASDDGRPLSPGSLSVQWGQVSGPGQALFSDSLSLTTTARFTVPGEYVLELRASDGERVSRDRVTVHVAVDSRPAPPGLVAWFPGNEDTLDIYGGHRAAAMDYAGFTPGKFGQAFAAKLGTTQRFTVPASPKLAFETQPGMSIEFWIRRTQFERSGIFLAFHTTGQQPNAEFRYYEGGYDFGCKSPTGVYHMVWGQSGGNWTGVWTHVALTFDAATRVMCLYANGVKIAESIAPAGWVPKTGGHPLSICRYTGGNSFMQTTEIDELSLYNRALTAAEVQMVSTFRKTVIGFNIPPSVTIGTPSPSRIDQSLTLAAEVNDDNYSGRPQSFSWSKVSGPGTATFGSGSAQQSTVSFSATGTYVLRCSVSDTEFTGFGDVTVQVVPIPNANKAPIVQIRDMPEFLHAGSTLALNADVTDDGLPGTSITYAWQRIEGVGQVTFSPANARQTTASFSAPGRYVLRLTANDSQLGGTDDVEVLVAHQNNLPPTVELGAPRTVGYGEPLPIQPQVEDDGQPGLGVTVHWSVQSGPGSVQMTEGAGADITAEFSRPGIYTLRLSADDGEFQAFDELEVTVTGGANQPPTVAMSSPLSQAVLTFGDAITLTATATDPEGELSAVEFYADGALVQSSLSATAQWRPATVGSHTLAVVAEDAVGQRVSSPPISVNVVAGPSTVALVYPPTGAAFAPGDLVALQANTAVAPGGAAVDHVTFLLNGSPIGTDLTAPYSATWSVPSGLGSYELTAMATDAAGQVVASLPVTVRAVTNPNAAPLVAITNLVGGESITAPMPITGTVDVPSLRDFRLEHRRKGAVCVDWMQFGAGAGNISNGTLGTFDPTVLLNGIYEVRLVARDAYGAEVIDQTTVGVEGGMKVGLFTVAFNDLELPLAGMPITVTRIYDSREHCPGDFGHGWKLDVESIRLDVNAPIGSGWNLDITDGTLTTPPVYQMVDQAAHIASVRMPDGQILRFSPKLVFARDYNRLASLLDDDGDDVAQAWIPLGNNTPLRMIYRPRGGTQGATLTPRGYRASGFVGSTTVAGNATFFPGDPYGGQLSLATVDNTTLDAPLVTDATGWDLRLKDGRVFLFDDRGRLEQMTDSVGNSLTIVRDGAGRVQRVAHSSGQQITFVRNAEGFVSEIEDPKGAKVHYIYDTAGDLRGFYDRATPLDAANATQSFSYKPGTHYLENLFDGKGVRASRSFYDTQGRLIRTVDADGKEVVLTHNVAGRTETIKDRTNRVTTHHYDERGNVVQTVEPDNTVLDTTYHVWSDGRKSELKTSESITGLFADENGALVQKTLTTSYAYEDDDASTPPANDGLLRKVVDPMGRATRFAYDDRGNVLTVTDPLDRTTTNTYYPGTTLLASTTDALQNTTTFTYEGGQMDKEIRTVTVIDADGATAVQTLVTDYDYDAEGRLRKLTDAANHVTNYTYDGNGNQLTSVTTRTDSNGAVRTLRTEHLYDDENRLTKTWDALHPRAGGHAPASETVYDANGKPEVTYDAERRATTMFYNSRGELTRTEYADQTSEQTFYDGEGRREFHDDRRGKRSQFLYDARGRLAETWFLGSGGDTPARLSMTIYDAAGRVYQSIDSRNQPTTFIYDAAGRRTATINARGERTSTAYDDATGHIFVTDAKNHTIQQVHDELNRRVRTVFAPAPVVDSPNAAMRTIATETKTVYDELGRRVAEYEQSAVDKPIGERRVTRYVYDKLGRLTDVVQPEVDGAVPITRYTYDEIGNQLTQTDALNRTTNYAYDDLGRRTGRQLPGGQSESVHYNRSGTVQERTDFNGTLTSFTYDALNRVLTRTSNHASAGLSNVSFTYTTSGQRWTMTDATGTTTYGYDHRDRLKTKATPLGTITYSYEDASGLLTRMQTDTPNGAAATYTYDELSRLETVSDVNSQTTTYAYDANGNLENVILPNGVTSTYAYSATNRLDSLSVQKAGTNLAQFNYALAATGHRYRSCETGSALQPSSPTTARNRVWQYDALWRLRNETLSGGVAVANGQSLPNGSAAYTLDAVGNRLNRNSSIAGLASQAFTYTSNDRVQGDLSDNNGNTLNGSVSQPAATGTFGQDTYDSENRLITRNGQIGGVVSNVNVLYDGDGHKVSESVTKSGVTTTTTHLVDELNPTGYAQVIEEKVNGTLTRVYLFGHDLISQDVAEQPGDPWQLVYFGYDGHGSTRFLTSPSGTVTDSYEYDAFGELLAHSGTTPNRYRYCGEQLSEALGLYYLRARLMNPLTGRFWTMDSYEGQRRYPSTFHKYGFGDCDPVTNVDPSGHFSLVEINVANAIRSIASEMQMTIGSSAGDTVMYGPIAALSGVNESAAITAGVSAILPFARAIAKPLSRFGRIAAEALPGGIVALSRLSLRCRVLVLPYSMLRATMKLAGMTARGFQAGHLLPDSLFARIPKQHGLAVPLFGSVAEKFSEHWAFHRTLEVAWDYFQRARFRTPTVGEFVGTILPDALQNAGFDPHTALVLAEAAAEQALNFGHTLNEFLPQIVRNTVQ